MDVELFDPSTGTVYLVDESEAEAAARQNGLRPPTAEESAQYDAEQRSGGFVSQLQTAGEEAVRKVASGVAAVARAVTPDTPAGLTELEPGQVDRVSTGEALTGNVGLEGVFSPEARERREVNPTAAALGGSVPAVAAGLLLPGAGVAGVAATIGIDAADADAQAALDAELESRDIRGEDVLRNAAINLLFSGSAAALGVGARAALRGGRSVLEVAAERASRALDARGVGATGDDLVEAMADPAARETLLKGLQTRADALVERSASELGSVKPAKVANNPNAQRQAVETIADAFEKTDPTLVAKLRQFEKGSPSARLSGLRDIRATLDDGSDLADALDNVLTRGDLWGNAALRSEVDLESALKLRPPQGATPEQLSAYTEALRKVPGLESAADEIDEVVERASEARVAATLPPRVKPKDAPRILRDAPNRQRAIRDAVVGPREKTGALQAWSDAFAALVSNAEKRETFEAFEATMPPAARAQLAAESRALASKAVDVIARLPDTAQDRILGFAEALEKSGSAADLDRLKNALQALRKRYAKVTNDVRAQDYMSAIDEVEPQLRAALENPEFVGKATADVQKARNAAWASPESGFIRNQSRMKAAGYNLMDTVEFDYDGRALLQVDAKAFESLMNAPPEQALKVLGYWDEQLTAATNIVGTVTKGAADGSSLAKFTAASKSLREQIQELRRIKLAEDIAARQGGPGIGGRIAGAVARKGVGMMATAAGSAVGGPVGAVVGAGLGGLAEAAAEAGAGLAVREAFGGVADTALRAVVSMRDAAERNASMTARLMVDAQAAWRFVRAGGDVAHAVIRFQGDHETPEQAFEEVRRVLQDTERNPERFVDLLTEEYGDIGQLSPKLHREVLIQATRVATYLRANLPGQRNVSVVYPNGTPPSRMEVRQFALRFTAATDPDSVLADARAGRLEHVQLDALKKLWPRDYDALRAGVLQELSTGRARTNARQRLSILFGFGSEIDPALGPRTRAVVAAARIKQDEQKQATPSAPAMQSTKLPSAAAQTPGGIASMQLGNQLTFRG